MLDFDSGMPARPGAHRPRQRRTASPAPCLPFHTPAARLDDPATSAAAARSVVGIAAGQRGRILAALAAETRPLTADEIAPRAGLPAAHQVQKRAIELERLGLVTVVDHLGLSRSGRRCARYAITAAGALAAPEVTA